MFDFNFKEELYEYCGNTIHKAPVGDRLPPGYIWLVKPPNLVDSIGESSITLTTGSFADIMSASWSFPDTAVMHTLDTLEGGVMFFDSGGMPIVRFGYEWYALLNTSFVWIGSRGVAGYAETQVANAARIQGVLRTYSLGSYYIVSGEDVWVRGALSESKHIAQNFKAPATPSTVTNSLLRFGNSHIIDPAAANDAVIYAAGEELSGMSDDVAPILTVNAGYFGGGHGMAVPVVVSTGHDKVSVDIGSVWSDGTYQFVLAEISGTSLSFYSVPYNTPWRMRTAVAGTLTHVSGATNTGNIPVTSQSIVQKYPCIKNKTITALANGNDVTAGGSGLAEYIDLVEEYDLVDFSVIDLTNNPWDWTDGVAWAHIKNTWRCSAGLVVVKSAVSVLRPMYINYYGVLQAGSITAADYSERAFYIPRTLPVSGYDFKTRQSFVGTTPTINLSDTYVSDVSNPPDRQIVFLKKPAESVPGLGFALGFSQFGDIVDHRGKDGAGYWWWISSGKKTYSIALGVNNITVPTDYEFTAYRQFFAPVSNNISAHVVEEFGRDILYIDLHGAASNAVVAVPSKYNGRAITVLDSETASISASVSGGTVTVSTVGSSYGYVVAEINQVT